jgi:hypothetical protein
MTKRPYQGASVVDGYHGTDESSQTKHKQVEIQ